MKCNKMYGKELNSNEGYVGFSLKSRKLKFPKGILKSHISYISINLRGDFTNE